MHWLLILTLASGLELPIETTEEACKATAEMFAAGSPVKVVLTPGYVVEAVDAVCQMETGA